MWAGLRFGLRGATAVNLALAIPAAAFTDTMMAPPDLVGRLASEVGASQAIVSILMILGPVLAAALQETGAHVAALLRSEQEIRRVGRLYASLSAVNHAVLTESTPESFLAATCRIIVEEGGLLLAAIGSVDRDQGLIVPLVYDGRAGDVVDKVTLPLRPGPGGLSPAAACVLEDEPQVCDDFLQDPRTAPWKQVAVEFNIRSSAALPVRRSDGVWGVLGLYANETGIFGSDELKLLTEIADIIGFALDSFAREQVRRETAAALGESEERFRLAMVHSPIGMALVATDGRWLEANPAVCRIVGYTRRELLDSDVQTITHAQDMAADLALMQDVLAGRRETYRLEKRYVRKNGTEVWTQLDSALVRSADGEPLYFLAKLQDITEQREARLRIAELNATLEKRVEERTQELAVANLELLSANRELEDFSSSVSHDLRSPLRLIDGFSQMLATEHIDPANEEALADIGRIRAAARRMGELIDSLLKLARNSRGAMNAEEVDLGAMAEEAMDAVRRQDPSRHVQLVVAPELRTVGSRALLRAVMDNLVSNAWKFTCHTADARIEVGCEARGGTPMFFVRDNGVGFDMRFVDQLFRPFHRLHAEHDFPGSGIGLATSRRILERHGGRIEAVGQIDVGASFYFTTAPAAAAGLVGTTSRSVST